MKNNTFEVLEDYQIPDVSKIESILNGSNSSPIYIVRDYIDENICEKLKASFYGILKQTNGGNRQGDFVPVLQVGSSQFNKSTSEYFKQCQETKLYIDEILNSVKEFEIFNDLFLDESLKKLFAKKNIQFGASSYENQYVNRFTIRKWTNRNDSSLSLLPHEDLSQLQMAKTDDYEISTITKVIACNLCIANSYKGQFIIWNIEPDEKTKKKLGVENKGYPYPIDMLDNVQKLVININPGDLYFINANLIHAVEEISSGERITMGRFIGACDTHKVVYWT